jgi:hypothetical protein
MEEVKIKDVLEENVTMRFQKFFKYKEDRQIHDKIAFEKWNQKEYNKEDTETDNEDYSKTINQKKEKINCKFCTKEIKINNMSHHNDSCIGRQVFNYFLKMENTGRSECRDCGKIYLRKNEKQHKCKKEKLIICDYCGFNFKAHRKCKVKTIIGNVQIQNSKIEIPHCLWTYQELKEIAIAESKTLAEMRRWLEIKRKRAMASQSYNSYRKEIDWISQIISELPEEYRQDDIVEDPTPIPFKQLIKTFKDKNKKKKFKPMSEKQRDNWLKKREERDKEIDRIIKQNRDLALSPEDKEQIQARECAIINKIKMEKYEHMTRYYQQKIDKMIEFTEIRAKEIEESEKWKNFKSEKLNILQIMEPKPKLQIQLSPTQLEELNKHKPIDDKIIDQTIKNRWAWCNLPMLTKMKTKRVETNNKQITNKKIVVEEDDCEKVEKELKKLKDEYRMKKEQIEIENPRISILKQMGKSEEYDDKMEPIRIDYMTKRTKLLKKYKYKKKVEPSLQKNNSEKEQEPIKNLRMIESLGIFSSKDDVMKGLID